MTTPPVGPELSQGVIAEWRPSNPTVATWIVLSIVFLYPAALLYWVVAARGAPSGTIRGGAFELVMAFFLSLAAGLAHEALHGVAVAAFGAKPRFGAALPFFFYTTTAGHRFTRGQFLAISLAPLAIVSPLAALACLLPFGGYLVVPSAVQLVGCVGDVHASWRVAHGPANALYEDFRDGLRVWSPDAPLSGAPVKR